MAICRKSLASQNVSDYVRRRRHKNVQQYRDSKGLDTTDTTDTSDNSLALLRPTEETTRHQLGAHTL